MADWQLSTCCESQEYWFLGLAVAYFFINFFLWNTFLLKPMKLIAVFFHEYSHAAACWLTGGKVNAIEVYNNEGGVTKYQGGRRCIIIPAGYLGGAFFGGLFVVLSGNRVCATCAASGFVLALLISLRFSPNSTLTFMSLGFSVVTIGFILIDRFVHTPFIQFVTLYYGVFIGAFSVYDIYDDLITRTVEGSDAHACHKLWPCCLPRCVGVQFAVVALVIQGLGVYFALILMVSDNQS